MANVRVVMMLRVCPCQSYMCCPGAWVGVCLVNLKMIKAMYRTSQEIFTPFVALLSFANGALVR